MALVPPGEYSLQRSNLSSENLRRVPFRPVLTTFAAPLLLTAAARSVLARRARSAQTAALL